MIASSWKMELEAKSIMSCLSDMSPVPMVRRAHSVPHIRRQWAMCCTQKPSDRISLSERTVIADWHYCSVDKKKQLDVTFLFIISLLVVFQHVSGNHVPIIRSWRLRDVVASCTLATERLSRPVGRQCVHGRTTCQPVLTTFLQPRHIPTRGYNITQSSASIDGHMVAWNMLRNY